MVVELVLHEACMLAYVSEDFSFADPGREAWIALPFSVAKLAQTTAIWTAGEKVSHLRSPVGCQMSEQETERFGCIKQVICRLVVVR